MFEYNSSIRKDFSWTMFANIVEKFGKLILCSPWSTSVESSSALRRLPTDILAWLTTVANVLLWVDSLFYTSWMTYMAADTISGAIEASLGYFAMMASELIIRSSSIIFRTLKVEMTHHLQSFPTRPLNCKHRRLILPVAMWIPAWFISCTIDNLHSELIQPLPKDFKPFLLPPDKTTLSVVYFLGNTWATLSILHAWTWVVVIGTALICRLEHFTEKFGALALRNSCSTWVTSRKGLTPFPLVSEFLIIKANFETYGKVAGAYSLALVIYFGVSIVGYLGGMMTENHGGDGYISELQRLLALIYLISMVIVINFGSRISGAVS